MLSTYLLQAEGLQTFAQLGAGLHSFLSLQSAGLHSVFVFAFAVLLVLSDAKEVPEISMTMTIPVIIFFIK